jgi:hypothetical protein
VKNITFLIKLQGPPNESTTLATQQPQQSTVFLNSGLAAVSSIWLFQASHFTIIQRVNRFSIMCRYDLSICPHPHQENVVNLIYNPDKQAEWHDCDMPRSWGKLSCGNLTIAHPFLRRYPQVRLVHVGTLRLDLQIQDHTGGV